MKKITYFKMRMCPFCRQADKFLEELLNENEKYRDIEIHIVDEIREKELAAKYDYYYVPAFFIDNKKLHEGAATKESIKQVLEAALK